MAKKEKAAENPAVDPTPVGATKENPAGPAAGEAPVSPAGPAAGEAPVVGGSDPKAKEALKKSASPGHVFWTPQNNLQNAGTAYEAGVEVEVPEKAVSSLRAIDAQKSETLRKNKGLA